MSDPYEVLGVPKNATEDQIKEAYRTLSRKYHPDNFNSNETMEELANEKMTEINAAYDKIMNDRRTGGSQSSSSGSSYSDIRTMIQSGQYTAAESALDSRRDDSSGEWNFLKGTVCLSRGWANDALTYFQKAVRLDPSNNEYRMALSQMQSRMNTNNMYGNPYSNNYNNSTNDAANTLCNICQCLMCANCLGDCFCS